MLIAKPACQIVELVEIAVVDADNATLAAMIDADNKAKRIG